MIFADRSDAGKRLATKLRAYSSGHEVIILALPQGGVPVAFEIAQILHLPMDLYLAHNIVVPDKPAVVMGAVTRCGVKVLDHSLIEAMDISEDAVKHAVDQGTAELLRNEGLYRHNRPMPVLENHTVILVDDGIADGLAINASIIALRQHGVREIIVATPIISPTALEKLKVIADRVIYFNAPEPFYNIGQSYSDFSPVPGQVIQNIMAKLLYKPELAGVG